MAKVNLPTKLDQKRVELYNDKVWGTKTPTIQTISLLIAAPWLWHSIRICTLPVQNGFEPNCGGKKKIVYALEAKLDLLVAGIEL